MNSTNLQVIPAPPSLMKSLMAGFDAVSNHIGVILFPVILDLLLWFSPRIRLTSLLLAVGEQSVAVSSSSGVEMLEWMGEMAGRLNLLSALRTFPVGIPSLMAARLPAANPVGEPLSWEAPSLEGAFGLWLLFTVCGIIFGALYFTIVAQIALWDKPDWRSALSQWPWASLQAFLLAVFWLVLILTSVSPFLCFLSVLLADGRGLEQLVLFGSMILALSLLWLLLPLAFSPHGIFVTRDRVWISVVKGARVARLTLPSTVLLFIVFLILGEGLEFLWNVPVDASWWMLVGVLGHAFIMTSLLAASFVYYRDAEHWIQQMVQRRELPTRFPTA